MLWLAHPELPSCADCKRFMYTDRWTLVKRCGQPVTRQPSTPTPCYKCPKIPAGKEPRPEHATEMTAKEWQALELYLQVKAGAPMPDDAIARRNCMLCRLAEDRVQQTQTNVGQLIPVLHRGNIKGGK